MEEQALKEIEMLKEKIELQEEIIELYKKLLERERKEHEEKKYITTTPWTAPIYPTVPLYQNDRVDPDWYKNIMV